MNSFQSFNKKLSDIVEIKLQQLEQKSMLFLGILSAIAAMSQFFISYSYFSDLLAFLIVWIGLSTDLDFQARLRDSSELFLAVLSQLGDIITTIYGIKSGLVERNPLVNYLINLEGLELFATVKAAVLGIVLFFYFKDLQHSRSLIRIAFILGLYLSLGNIFVLWL